MMERYEEKALLNYMDNLLADKAVHRCLDGSFWDWVMENPLLFGLSEQAELKEIEGLCRRRGSAVENRAVQQQSAVELLRAALKSRLRVVRSPGIGSLEKLLRAVAEVFALEPEESAVFGLLARFQCYAYLKQLASVLSGGNRGSFGSLEPFELISRMLGLPQTAVAAALHKNGRLVRSSLIEFDMYQVRAELNRRMNQMLNQRTKLKTARAVKNYLTGPVQKAALHWEDFGHLGDERELLAKIVGKAVQNREKGINILLYGEPGTGKTEFCKALVAKLGIELYAVAETDANNDEPSRLERLQSLKMLQSLLAGDLNSCILLDEAEDVFGGVRGPKPQSKIYMNRLLESNPAPVFWLTNSTQQIDPATLRRMTYCMKFSALPEERRLQMSLQECARQHVKVSPAAIAKITAELKPSPAVFANAVRAARLAGGGEAELLSVIENVGALLGVTRQATLDQLHSHDFSLELLNTDVDLTRLSVELKRKGRLDFSFCLSGYPGTGKSEFARWLSSQLGLPVLMKRASSLSSKWVGETEKNIAAAFAEAREKKQILVFDEADSFLLSRRQASHSWEVTQVNEMLTWMERHPYPFICTTNFDEKLDEAAFRRFTFKVRFDYLNRQQVRLAFRQFFGTEAPPEALRMTMLSPSDFAVVRKKCSFLEGAGGLELTEMLRQETAVKSGRTVQRSIGFLARSS